VASSLKNEKVSIFQRKSAENLKNMTSVIGRGVTEKPPPPPIANNFAWENKYYLATEMPVGHDFRHALLVAQNKLTHPQP
jgi:hypothetical protein